MKYQELNKFKSVRELDSLIFFSQSCNEMLWHYSSELYRPSYRNAYIMIREAKSLYRLIDTGAIDKANFDVLSNEIIAQLEVDLTAQHILGGMLESVKKGLAISNSIEDRKIYVNMVNEIFETNNHYVEVLIDSLSKSIVTNASKKEIRKFTNTWLSTLIHRGYSKESLYSELQYYFYYNPSDQITSNTQVHGILERFNLSKSSFEVVFRIPVKFENILSNTDIFRRSIESGDSITTNHSDFFSDFTKYKYLVISVKSYDETSARKSALRQLNTIYSLISIYHHKELEEYNSDVVVISENNKTKLLNSPLNVTSRIPDRKLNEAEEKILRFIQSFSSNEIETVSKIGSVVKLHNEANLNNDSNSKLLNLWVALEIILITDYKKNKSKIEKISKNLKPFILINYLKEIVLNLYKDLKRWNRHSFNDTLKQVEVGRNNIDKFLYLISFEDYKQLSREFENELNCFSLLQQ